MEGFLAIFAIFIALPWLIFHYITKWKTAATLTNDDEKTLTDLYEMARFFEQRIDTIERIIAADNPGWRPTLTSSEEQDPLASKIDSLRSQERSH